MWWSRRSGDGHRTEEGASIRCASVAHAFSRSKEESAWPTDFIRCLDCNIPLCWATATILERLHPMPERGASRLTQLSIRLLHDDKVARPSGRGGGAWRGALPVMAFWVEFVRTVACGQLAGVIHSQAADADNRQQIFHRVCDFNRCRRRF
jgi:hypothetical protein